MWMLSYLISDHSMLEASMIADICSVDFVTFSQYYQTLFCKGECFLHVVSLLNGTFNEITGELLVLNVLQTLTLLLSGNDNSKVFYHFLKLGLYLHALGSTCYGQFPYVTLLKPCLPSLYSKCRLRVHAFFLFLFLFFASLFLIQNVHIDAFISLMRLIINNMPSNYCLLIVGHL